MSQIDWKQAIIINILKLKAVGLWPQKDESYNFNLYTLYAIFSFVCIIFAHNFFQTVNIFFLLDDLKAITATIYFNLSELLGILKAYYLMRNMPILKKMMATLRTRMFQPKSTHQKNLIERNIQSWKVIYFLYWSMSGGAIFFWIFIPVLTNEVKNFRLPFMAWYPFDAKKSPFYGLAYCHQVLGVVFVATSTLGVDTLIAALFMFIGAQLDLLCDNLRSLKHENYELDLIECITHHREILKFTERANLFNEWIIFFQFFISATSIGITMFQITIVEPFGNEFISIFSFEVAIIVEIFMYCWFANEVKKKSEKISYSIFESDWTGVSLKSKKAILFFMLVCKKPIKISALNLFDLSLETFIKILRASWSYFALLQQMSTRK